MPPATEPRQVLSRLFRRHQIADLELLCTALGTRSRMTVFRRLSATGYHSSCSHAGRYYSLAGIPEFDQDGLWQHQGVLFSRDGTLKDTVVRLVETADAGRLHRELEQLLRLRVHNTLGDLVRCRRIGREPFQGAFLYLGADRARAAIQRECRAAMAVEAADPDPSLVLEILLEVIHGSVVQADAGQVHARLAARGVVATVAQVQEVFRRHDVQKKTVPSPSRRSRR